MDRKHECEALAQPDSLAPIVAELDALQAEVDALKRLQAETPVNNTGQAATELALLQAILPSPTVDFYRDDKNGGLNREE